MKACNSHGQLERFRLVGALGAIATVGEAAQALPRLLCVRYRILILETNSIAFPGSLFKNHSLRRAEHQCR